VLRVGAGLLFLDLALQSLEERGGQLLFRIAPEVDQGRLFRSGSGRPLGLLSTAVEAEKRLFGQLGMAVVAFHRAENYENLCSAKVWIIVRKQLRQR
jgi:hypothetical protein